MATKRTNTLHVLLCLAAALGLSLAAGARAAGPDLAQLVADLGSPDIATREEATRRLSAEPTVTLHDLEVILSASDLSGEQRCRLMDAAKARFLTSPRPAMGVRFDTTLRDRVAIDTLYPKFPASADLEVGDIVIECEGQKLRSPAAWVELGAHIFAREPGDTLSIVIRRGAKKMNLQVKLGAYADLGSGDFPDIERLQLAWDVRAKSLRPDAQRVIAADLPPSVWQPEPSAIEAAKLSRFKAQLPQDRYRPRLVAGGEARGGELDYDELLILAQQNPRANALVNNRGWNQRFAAQGGMNPAWGELRVISQTTKQELSAIESKRVMIQRQIEALKSPANAKPGQAVQTETFLELARLELARLQKLTDAINAEAAEEPADEPLNVEADPR